MHTSSCPHINITIVKLCKWQIEEHWTHKACDWCSSKGILCVLPPANGKKEKCNGCSEKDSNKTCNHKWILDWSSTLRIKKLVEAGKSQEEAELIVDGPGGKLGGAWDRGQTYC